ncbi:MAG: ROK family protein [Clostridia bacterium]|nr:ROK family protein [Clostridia bacterium]
MKDRWLGLDIGGTKCAVILAKLDMGIVMLDRIAFPTEAEKGFERAYSRMTGAIADLFERNAIDESRLRGIGISCGGPLDSERGVIICPPNLPGWENIPIVSMFEERFGVPVFLQNDANACALVEWRMGAGRGLSNMIFLTMGTGMGAGIIADGRLIRGFSDMCGEVGHMRLCETGPVGYGKSGSFEGFASGGGIDRQAIEMTKRLIDSGDPPAWIMNGHSLNDVNAGLLAAYARSGDSSALKLFGDAGRMLGRGIALLVDVLNPELIVIGSVFARCEDLLRPAMQSELEKEALEYSLKGLRVVPAQTGDNIGDLASVAVAVEGTGTDPQSESEDRAKAVMYHYERLFDRYGQLTCCKRQIYEAYEAIERCYANGNKLLLAGNGGSCADCEHIVGELMKGFYLKRPVEDKKRDAIREATRDILPGAADILQQGLPAIALTGHAAVSTAVQNDVDPQLAMAQQVLGYGRPGDAFIGISTSGNAKNVLLAASVAKALGLKTIALTGENGGELKRACDITIAAPATSPADVQEMHLPIYHTLCAMIEARFFKS